MFLEAKGRRDELQKLQDAWSASGAIVVSTPFAMAEFLPPQVPTLSSQPFKQHNK